MASLYYLFCVRILATIEVTDFIWYLSLQIYQYHFALFKLFIHALTWLERWSPLVFALPQQQAKLS